MLSKQVVNTLKAIDDLLSKYQADEQQKHYINSQIAFKRALQLYFLGLQTRLPRLVQNNKVNKEQIQHESLLLASVMAPFVATLYHQGAASTMEKLLSQGATGGYSPATDFLEKYTIDLAGGITKTTEQDLTDEIAKSLRSKEDADQMLERLNDTLNNVKRSRMIAQTESVRAFSAGRIATGKAMGWQGKKWIYDGGNCTTQVCPDNEAEGVIPIDDTFTSGNDFPTAHPNCGCDVEIVKVVPGVDE